MIDAEITRLWRRYENRDPIDWSEIGQVLRALISARHRNEELERELAVTRQRCAALELLAKERAP